MSILKDGFTNLKGAVNDLLDARPTTVDGKNRHPLIDALEGIAGRENWMEDSSVRVRDMGHVFHAEVFVVPKDGHNPTMDQDRGPCGAVPKPELEGA